MAENGTRPITELLTVAAVSVTLTPDREPWDYGWHLEEYRQSTNAALNSSRGPVSLTGPGITAYEEAVTRLLRENKIRDRWESDEFWGLVAVTVVVAASRLVEADRHKYVQDRINYLRDGDKALTIQLVANVTWDRPPLLLGTASIGNANDEFLRFVNSSAHGRTSIDDDAGKRWIDSNVQSRTATDIPAPVAIACWTTGQNLKAFEETERQLSNIVDLALLLERDLATHKIYRRGDINRPGIRGLALDRSAIARNLDQAAGIELSASQLTITKAGDARSIRWFDAEPLPLGTLLDQSYLREAVQSCLKDDPISNRVKVAARWFAEAHYTLAADDAALGLGVAVDSLLSGRNSLPGNAMADRVAMLEEDPPKRPELVRNYLNFYQARSSVAHSGRSSKLTDKEFMNAFRDFVHWTAWRSLALRDKFTISSEKAVDSVYNDLRWGLQSWAD